VRRTVKWIVLGIVFVLTAPWGYSARLLYVLFRSRVLFEMFAQGFALLPGLPGDFARACFYKQTLAESHLDTQFMFGAVISKFETRIGRNAILASGSSVGLADVEDGAVIGNRVVVLSGRHQHGFDDPARHPMEAPSVFTRIRIGRNSFVGDNAVVMADVGCNTIIGAGSVVVKDMPDFVVAVGNPARVVKQRQPTEVPDAPVRKR
jgi:acetyltransferase-like isoleucine patch superfamily enzyme